MSISPVDKSVLDLPALWLDRESEREKPPEKPEPKNPDGGLNYCW